MQDQNLIDWDYWPYLWLIFTSKGVCIKDANGWLYITGQPTIGL